MDGCEALPVILVPGRLCDPFGWLVLERHLKKIGFDHVATLWRYRVATVPQLACGLAAMVDATRVTTGAPLVYLIGQGTGGVAVRYYLERLGGDSLVEMALFMDSPAAPAPAGGAARLLSPRIPGTLARSVAEYLAGSGPAPAGVESHSWLDAVQ